MSKNRFKIFGELWNKLEDNTKDKYKEINNLDEYLNIVNDNNDSCIELYVDGSYKKNEEIYSYAFIIVKNMKILFLRKSNRIVAIM